MKELNNDQALILDIKATDRTVRAQATQIAWSVITPAQSGSNPFEVINPSYHIGGHQQWLRPHRKVQPESLALFGADNAMLRDAPEFDYFIPRFIECCDSRYIICHNAERAIRLLKNASVISDDIEQFKFICLTSLAKQVFKLSDFSTPVLYAASVPNLAARDLHKYYSGMFDPLFLRTIYERLILALGVVDFESSYQKSLDPNFDVVAYREVFYA